MRVPACFAALPLLAGTTAGLLLWDIGPDSLPLCAAGAALLALLAGLAALADDRRGECTAAVVIGCLSSGVALGADAAERTYSPPLLRWYQDTQPTHAVVIEGLLREDAGATPFGVSLVVDACRVGAGQSGLSGRHSLGGVRLTVGGSLAPGQAGTWRGGRMLRVTATIRRPPVYHNPGVRDDGRALARRGVVLVGSIKSAALVERVRPGSILKEAAAASRAWARTQLNLAVGEWSRRSAGIAAAILIGDRTGLSQEDERRLQEAGTYHVVAISGGNIAILTLLLLGVMRLLRVPRRGAAAATMLLLAVYGEIVVPAASVSRAITAATAYLAGRMLDQSGAALNVLSVAACAAIAFQPVGVFDPAFLLSFGATLGILVGVPRMRAALCATSRPLAAAVAIFCATIAADVTLAPIGATFFSRVSFAGLVLNLLAIPLMTCVQAGSMLVLALAPIDPDLARLTGRGVHIAAFGLVESARLVEFAPWLSLTVAPPALWVAATYYAAVIAAVASARYVRVACVAATVLALAMLAGVPLAARDRIGHTPAGWLRVVFLDVGQADATVLVLPDRRALLVDAGGLPFAPPEGQEGTGYDIGTRLIAPALHALGVRRLDTMVITHGDPDHLGGAGSIVRQFRPRAIWEGVPVPPHEPLRRLMGAAAAAGSEWRNVQRGDLVRAAGIELRVLHPPPPDWERQRVRNEDSIVLEVRQGRVSILLPGDIGREGETAVVAAYTRSPFTILKAPHHGSATSSSPTFVTAVRPDAVIFSAGRGSRFGHPAPAVVSRYRALGTAIFSTADDGAVIVDTDGQTVEVWTWLGRRAVFQQ